MIFGVYAVRDRLTGFLTPTTDQNDAAAIRNFQFACDNTATLMYSNPLDYELCKVGTFDSDLGVLSPISPIEVLTNGTCALHLKEGVSK